MEKLVVLSDDKVRLLTDAKKFNYKWMEQIDGQWVEITDIHFDVSHLSEAQITDLMVTLDDSVSGTDTSWTEKIDWNDPEIVAQMQKDQYILEGIFNKFDTQNGGRFGPDGYLEKYKDAVEWNEETGEVKIDGNKQIQYEKEIWLPTKQDDTVETRTFTVPVGKKTSEEAKRDLANLIKQYQEELTFDDTSGLLNYEVKYDYVSRDDKYNFYVERRESKEITQQMIYLISSMISYPTIMCEDEDLEDSIMRLVSSFDLNTRKLVQKLLNEGTIAYERLFDARCSNVIGLREIQTDLLRCESNIWKHGYGAFERHLLRDQVSLIQFYPNDEFESYAEMMDCLYEAYDLDKEDYKLNCYDVNGLEDYSIPASFRQKAFIKKSFIEDRYFNVANEDSIDNEESFDTFLNLLEGTIAEFYENLIRADERFRKEEFSIKV